MASEFTKGVEAFSKLVDQKRAAVDLKAAEIQQKLEDEEAQLEKRTNLLAASNLLNQPESKDFPMYFDPSTHKLDGDTIKLDSFYGDKFQREIRLGSSDPGVGIDTYESAKYDKEGNLLPYNPKKFKYHATHYAKVNGLPNASYVSQQMLNDAAKVQTDEIVKKLTKGQLWDDYGKTPTKGVASNLPKPAQERLSAIENQMIK